MKTKVPTDANELSRYLVDVSQVPLLSKEEELDLAREIEALEIAHWRALLSYRPALAVVASAASQALTKQAPKLEALAAGAGRVARDKRETVELDEAARELRTLDERRTALREVDRAVRGAYRGNARAAAYLARVERARRAQEAAKARFVAANLRLVVSMASRHRGSGLARVDLIQEGNLGLMRAVERFDHRRGLRFSTYASWWIRHYMNRALADTGNLIRVPVHALETRARIERLTNRTLARTGRAPTPETLTQELHIDEDTLDQVAATELVHRPTSLDRTAGESNQQTWHDLIPDPDQEGPQDRSERESSRLQVLEAMRELGSFEAAILRFRFGFEGDEELSLREVGEKYNLSRERIRQIQERALQKLRVALGAQTKAA